MYSAVLCAVLLPSSSPFFSVNPPFIFLPSATSVQHWHLWVQIMTLVIHLTSIWSQILTFFPFDQLIVLIALFHESYFLFLYFLADHSHFFFLNLCFVNQSLFLLPGYSFISFHGDLNLCVDASDWSLKVKGCVISSLYFWCNCKSVPRYTVSNYNHHNFPFFPSFNSTCFC